MVILGYPEKAIGARAVQNLKVSRSVVLREVDVAGDEGEYSLRSWCRGVWE